MERSPQMSGFGLKASTQRKDTKANRQAHGYRLCTPSVFASEAMPTTGQDAHSLIETDRCGLIDARHVPIATKFQSASDISSCWLKAAVVQNKLMRPCV